MDRLAFPHTVSDSHHKPYSNAETPFSMAYGAKAMSLVEVGPSPLCMHFNGISNDKISRCELDFFEERCDDSQIRLASYQ